MVCLLTTCHIVFMLKPSNSSGNSVYFYTRNVRDEQAKFFLGHWQRSTYVIPPQTTDPEQSSRR